MTGDSFRDLLGGTSGDFGLEISDWMMEPEKTILSDEDRVFLKVNNVVLSTAYIGMVRAYCGNRTVWQTSSLAPFLRFCDPTQSYEERVEDSRKGRECLVEQTREWVSALRDLTEEELWEYLSRHVPLF